MNNPAAVVYDNLSGFAKECLAIADEALDKLAAVTEQLEKSKAAHQEALVLTKVAASDALHLPRVAATVDRMVRTGFVTRANRNATINGLLGAPRSEIFEVLEKYASIAICPSNALSGDEDGEVVEKAAGQTDCEGMSKSDALWRNAWEQAKAESGT